MDEIIVVEKRVDEQGIMRLHLMSNAPIADPSPKSFGFMGREPKIERQIETGAYHLRVEWPFSGPAVMKCEGWPVPKIFVVWNLDLGESVTRVLYEAANQYQDIFGVRPGFAFIRKMPRGIESGKDVGDLTLFEAEWMVRKCVAVGWHYR